MLSRATHRIRVSLSTETKRQLSSSAKRKIGILGVPFDKGQKKWGVGAAPAALRKAGLKEALSSLGHDVRDFGDVSYREDVQLQAPENMLHYEHLPPCLQEVSLAARRIHAEGRVCLTLGGDHSVAIGTVDASVNSHQEVALLWVDAHADINTPATSETGSVHGMPVARLVQELANYWPATPGMGWQVPRLSLRNVAYIGLRSVDEYERLILDKFDVCAFGMQDVERLGIDQVVRRALDHIDPQARRLLHLSFDIDALDISEAPSTGTPVRGGLSLREGLHVMELVHDTGRLAAVDLVEINPELGSGEDAQHTLDAGLQLLGAAFGNCRLGNLTKKCKDIPLTREQTQR